METHTEANCTHINPSVLWVYFMDWNLAIEKGFHYVHNKVNERGMVITHNISLDSILLSKCRKILGPQDSSEI